MAGVLEGFATIGVVVGLGFVLAHFEILGVPAQLILSRLAFYVASPALLIVVMSRTPIRAIFSANLVASFASVVLTVALSDRFIAEHVFVRIAVRTDDSHHRHQPSGLPSGSPSWDDARYAQYAVNPGRLP